MSIDRIQARPAALVVAPTCVTPGCGRPGRSDTPAPRRALGAALCLLAGVLLLCGVAAVARATTPGWKTYRVAGADITIELPSAFVPVDYAHASSPSRDPAMAAALAIALKNKLVKFFAVALEQDTLLDVTIVEFSRAQRSKVSLGAELSSALIQAGISPRDVHEASVTLPAGSAKRLTVTVSAFGVRMLETEFTLAHRGSELEIGFIAPASQAARFSPLFARSMQTMRFLR